MAPPLRYLRPGEQESLNTWLSQRLQEERRDVLLHLEETHRDLIEQFFERANMGFGYKANLDFETSDYSARSRERGLPPVPDVGRSRPGDPNNVAIVPNPAGFDMDYVGPPSSTEDFPKEPLNSDENKADAEGRTGSQSLTSAVGAGLSRTSGLSEVEAADTPSATPVQHFETTPRGQAFEWFFAFVIFVNAVVMAAGQQYDGLERGFILGYPTYTHSKETAWPGGEFTFSFLEKVFAVIFTVELILRIAIYRLRCLKEPWTYFDLVIVAFAWIIFFQSDWLGFNPTFVRLARLSKLLRLVKLLQQREIFDSLKLLIAAIKASTHTLIWSLCVLFLIIASASLFMNQLLESYLEETKTTEAEKEAQLKVFGYYGTFWRSLLTMFEVTFANWVPSCRTLVNYVGEGYGAFYLFYRCVVGLAVIMVVQAVFIQQTTKATQLDDATIATQKARAKEKFLKRLEKAFKKLDKTGDGVLDWSEFQTALQDGGEMAGILAVFDLEVSEFDLLFKLLDDGDGQISIDEFIAGVQHMKGVARAIDVMEIKQMIKKVETRIKAS